MKKGFSTLFVVIILGSISLGLVLFFTTSSLWAIKSGTNVKNSNQSKSLVNACAEIVLKTIREDNNYTGSGSVVLGGNTCNYMVTNNGGTTRSIVISGVVVDITRKLQITTTSFNPLIISSWQEVE
jgi:hypothetical protein